MNDYEILSLMDTHKAAKAQGLDVPITFAEFLKGVQPLGQNPPLFDQDTPSEQHS